MRYIKAKRKKNGLYIVEFIILDNSVSFKDLESVSSSLGFSVNDNVSEFDDSGYSYLFLESDTHDDVIATLLKLSETIS